MQHAAPARMAISVPTPDVEALTKTCMELKQAVEQITGRYNEKGLGGAPRMTLDDQPPKIPHDGDFWLSTGATNVLSVALHGKWYKVGVLTP